jgi:hypothetical protein
MAAKKNTRKASDSESDAKPKRRPRRKKKDDEDALDVSLSRLRANPRRGGRGR